jgi:hypothetical protein
MNHLEGASRELRLNTTSYKILSMETHICDYFARFVYTNSVRKVEMPHKKKGRLREQPARNNDKQSELPEWNNPRR